MNINEFVKEFNERTDKIQCVKEHIVEKYIPYEKKMAICKNVINHADYTTNINGLEKKYYAPNTPLRFVLFSISIVDSYTDIKLKKNKSNRDVMGGFNKLNSIGFFELLFSELNREYKEINTILQMMVEDTINKENSLTEYFNTKLDSLKIIYDTFMPIIENKIVSFPNLKETE